VFLKVPSFATVGAGGSRSDGGKAPRGTSEEEEIEGCSLILWTGPNKSTTKCSYDSVVVDGPSGPAD
jgi:hypothetical protein